MNSNHHSEAGPVIDPHVVQEAQDVTRWAWMRDHCTVEQLEILGSAIKGANSQFARQKAMEEIADHFIAQSLLASIPRRDVVAPPDRFHLSPVIHLPRTASA